jgi:hypothetical protein
VPIGSGWASVDWNIDLGQSSLFGNQGKDQYGGNDGLVQADLDGWITSNGMDFDSAVALALTTAPQAFSAGQGSFSYLHQQQLMNQPDGLTPIFPTIEQRHQASQVYIAIMFANPRSFDTFSIMLPTRCWSPPSRSQIIRFCTISLISSLELLRGRVSRMTPSATLCFRYRHSTSESDWTKHRIQYPTTPCTISVMSSGVRLNCYSRRVLPLTYPKAITVPRTSSLRQWLHCVSET